VEKGKIPLTIRATNGANWETDDFNLNQHVDHVKGKAVKHFVDEGAMVDGDYLLALIAGGQARELPDSAKLGNEGVVNGSVLALLVRGPQIDG
jgi:hypothetical protein